MRSLWKAASDCKMLRSGSARRGWWYTCTACDAAGGCRCASGRGICWWWKSLRDDALGCLLLRRGSAHRK